MYNQLMEDKRSAIDWLSKRLELQLDDYSGMFYRVEYAASFWARFRER